MLYQHFISPKTQFHHLSDPFVLESEEVLVGVQIAYRTWGTLNEAQDNAVLVCHALTGWADVEAWWKPLLGEGRSLDPTRDFVICSNILGSCYGTTGPTSLNPETGKPYGSRFPAITIRDMVRLQAVLLKALGVQSLRLAIGGSLGGMQVLEWALLYPEWVQAIAVIAAPARHSAWCIGLSEAQRQAIFTDPNWQNGNYAATQKPDQGLATARIMAMSTYRSWTSFSKRFERHRSEQPNSQFEIVQYLHYQGQKLVERFDANTYIALTYALDSHDIARPNHDHHSVLKSIQQPTLVVAITSDILYPPIEQQELVASMPNSELHWLNSPHGHDAFLIDLEQLNDLIVKFQHRIRTDIQSDQVLQPSVASLTVDSDAPPDQTSAQNFYGVSIPST